MVLRIKLGHKYYEWSLATLILRLMKWGMIKRTYVHAQMMLSVHDQMGKWATKQKQKGNKVDAHTVKHEAMRKLGQSGMALLKEVNISERDLYTLAEKAARG